MRARVILLVVSVLLLGAGLLEASARTASVAPPAASAAAAPAATGSPAAQPPAPAPSPAAPAPPPVVAAAPAATPPTLAQRVAALLADPRLAGIPVSVSVRTAEGTTVLDHAATASLLPASTAKLATAAAALATLGPDFRYTTRVAAAGGPAPDGTVQGDLVLVGSGDPTLSTETFRREVDPQRPATPIEALADQLVAAGVRRVTGGVLADPTVFAHQPLAQGWRERYLTELDATRVSGLTVDAGRKLFVEGGTLRASASPDPAAEAAAALHTALRRRGVQVDGGVATVTTPTTAGLHLAAVQSPRLHDLLVWTVQHSDNHLADAIFRTLGAAAGEATWRGGDRAVRAALAPLNLDWSGVGLADGSGLSRDDRMPAAFLSALDAAMSRSNLAAQWRSYQAVAGETGTLRKRLRGTLAEHRLRGKTGSLEDVRALTGSVLGPGGRRYHFAVVINALPRAARDAARSLQDELILALVEDLHACIRIPLPAGSPAPYELHCGRAA